MLFRGFPTKARQINTAKTATYMFAVLAVFLFKESPTEANTPPPMVFASVGFFGVLSIPTNPLVMRFFSFLK